MRKCNKCGVALIAGETWHHSAAKHRVYTCIECVRARTRKWEQENRERHLASVRRSRRNKLTQNPDYYRQWYQANLEQARANGRIRYHRRQARIAKLPHTLTQEQWQEILEEYGHACAYCGRGDVPLEQEHKVPVTRGGGYTRENIVPACVSCNRRKGTKTAEELA